MDSDNILIISIAAIIITAILAFVASSTIEHNTAVEQGLVQCYQSGNPNKIWTIPANCK